jgi:hypothetical protein
MCFHDVRIFYEDGNGTPWNYSEDTQ